MKELDAGGYAYMLEIDPSQVLRDGRNLVERGEYEEALRKYLWFHEYATTLDPDLRGVRRSIALRYWAKLGEVYPPAKMELEKVRDAKTGTLMTGSLDRELFDDVNAINETLAQEDRTSYLFAKIAERDPEFAQKCFRSARSALVRTRDYALARSFIKSPRESLARLAFRLNESIEESPAATTVSLVLLRDADIENYAQDVREMLAILVGVGEVEEADHIRIVSVDLISSSDVRNRLKQQLA